MINETDILLEIYSEVTNNIEHIKTSKMKRNAIKNKIDALNNNFFDVKCNEWLFNQYLGYYKEYEEEDPEEILDYNDLIQNLEILKGIIETNIKNTCNHVWIMDDIDVTPDLSQSICYCSKCEITKK